MPQDHYAGSEYKKYLSKLRSLCEELPPFCGEFFRGIEHETLVRSRYAYGVDLRNFFSYLIQQPGFARPDIRSIPLSDLDKVDVTLIEGYLSYVSYYIDEGEKEVLNGDRAKKRKLSTLRSFYKYFCKKEKLHNNPPSLVDLPVIRERSIIRLEPDEVANLLDIVEAGEGLTEGQKKIPPSHPGSRSGHIDPVSRHGHPHQRIGGH